MAYGIVHQFKGGTKEQYEASIAAVHPADGGLPAGQLFHAAGPSTEGWTIVAIHDTQESWETFRDTILGPRMQAGIDGGFTSPPEETGVASGGNRVRGLQRSPHLIRHRMQARMVERSPAMRHDRPSLSAACGDVRRLFWHARR